MATIFNAPQELGVPPAPNVPAYDPGQDNETRQANYKQAIREYEEATTRWIESVKQWCRDNGTGPNRGEVVRFPMADGYAEYVVLTNTQLIHLPVYDAWDIPAAHARGLRASDITRMVAQERKLAELFGGR